MEFDGQSTLCVVLDGHTEKEMYIKIFSCFFNSRVLGFYSFYSVSVLIFESRLHHLMHYVTLPLQIFQRFEGDEIVNIDDARFEHFSTKVCYTVLEMFLNVMILCEL